MKLRYPTVEGVKILQQLLIDRFGGEYALRDAGALESALMRPQTGYYGDIVEESAALMESLVNNHPFIDGNKRTAFFTIDAFLRANGYYIECDNDAAYAFFVGLFETGAFNFGNLEKWIREKIKPL